MVLKWPIAQWITASVPLSKIPHPFVCLKSRSNMQFGSSTTWANTTGGWCVILSWYITAEYNVLNWFSYPWCERSIQLHMPQTICPPASRTKLYIFNTKKCSIRLLLPRIQCPFDGNYCSPLYFLGEHEWKQVNIFHASGIWYVSWLRDFAQARWSSLC